MLILAILFTLVLAAAFAVVPARLGRRKPTRADGCCALLPAVLVWLWAACIWSKPGLTIFGAMPPALFTDFINFCSIVFSLIVILHQELGGW